ncbi:MAG: serine hydrolase domain-containing protein [Christensenellales bacterium]|jgi:CubicO group peptidase (beta-lactamase class C family)
MRFVTPESRGVPSQAVARFIDRLNERRLPMHSFLMMRGGDVIAEGYWQPFNEYFLHRLYSCSKSFVSIAVGLLIGEGKLHLDDKVISFFPEELPDAVHPYLEMTTVRDLLRMATSHNENAYTNRDANWVRTFLHRTTEHVPGTVFSYDTAGTVMLNAIVEKLSGQELVEYLRPRLFDPIGVSKDAWCVGRPEGGAWGGSGMMLTTRDFARVANIVMHMGRHEGRQLIPEAYLREATTKQIDTRTAREEPETQQGYGYQFWITRNDGFAFLGMGTQVAICLPKKDFLLITTADTQGISSGYANLFAALWEEIFLYLDENLDTLPEDEAAHRALREKTASLTLLCEEGAHTSPLAKEIDGKTYVMDENPMGIRRISFGFSCDLCTMRYENATGEHEILFGFGRNIEGEFPETGYYGRRIGEKLERGYRCLCSAAWGGENSLQLRVNICDWYFGNCNIDVGFRDEFVTVRMAKTAEWFLEEYQGFAAGRMQA